ncbi:sphingosine kinase 1-like isoform X2 [Solanum dulcamara]|uniref:sphingosine kinase 1-like isoform X2 n=1 Tax=Solanum dulcamara TaxID=45834 RepID=UPI0024867DAE|nr:sphingosine kinase 1-like isoform X2 [Solanum dulcamara]
MGKTNPTPVAPVLSDRVRVNGVETLVTFTAEEGILRWTENCLSIEKEVLGFTVEGTKIKVRAIKENDGGGIICCSGNTGVTVKIRSYNLEMLSEVSLRIWTQKLQEFIDSLGRPKRLFVFVNPYGGKRSASKIFIDSVKPLLDDANIDYTVQETKYQLHAKEVAKSLDILRYDGIVCVSGDGILVEVVNGLLEREDWDSAIKMPLGVVPAGTGNGMAKSLLDAVGLSCTVANATLAIIRGHKQSLDVATISQEQNRFFSVLMLAWGLIADIDIESEKYRWMGSARIDYYAMQRIFCLRRYNGCIKFVAAPGYETFGEPADLEGETITEVKLSFVQHKGYCGPAFHMKEFNRKIEGPFVSVWLHNVPWGGEDALAAPDAKVKSFVLEPGTQLDDPSKEGIIDVDGEVLARGKGTYKSNYKTLMTYEKLHIKIDQGLATMFSPSTIS